MVNDDPASGYIKRINGVYQAVSHQLCENDLAGASAELETLAETQLVPAIVFANMIANSAFDRPVRKLGAELRSDLVDRLWDEAPFATTIATHLIGQSTHTEESRLAHVELERRIKNRWHDKLKLSVEAEARSLQGGTVPARSFDTIDPDLISNLVKSQGTPRYDRTVGAWDRTVRSLPLYDLLETEIRQRDFVVATLAQCEFTGAAGLRVHRHALTTLAAIDQRTAPAPMRTTLQLLDRVLSTGGRRGSPAPDVA